MERPTGGEPKIAPSGASKRFAQQNLVLGGIHFRRYKIKSERRRALARRSPKNRVRFEHTLFFGTGGGNRIIQRIGIQRYPAVFIN